MSTDIGEPRQNPYELFSPRERNNELMKFYAPEHLPSPNDIGFLTFHDSNATLDKKINAALNQILIYQDRVQTEGFQRLHTNLSLLLETSPHITPGFRSYILLDHESRYMLGKPRDGEYVPPEWIDSKYPNGIFDNDQKIVQEIEVFSYNAALKAALDYFADTVDARELGKKTARKILEGLGKDWKGDPPEREQEKVIKDWRKDLLDRGLISQ